jgi:hypothetical protein
MIAMPAAESTIDSLELVLHVPIAIDYFYEYLSKRENPLNFRLLALYMDIRCYDVEIRKDMRLLEVVDTYGNRSRLSMYSEHSAIDADVNYQESANKIAIQIYNDYLTQNA